MGSQRRGGLALTAALLATALALTSPALAGDGTFTTRSTPAVGGSPSSIAVSDVNGDGRADLVTTSAISNTVSVLLGDGTGGFAAALGAPPGTGSSPRSITVADLNGDGNQDLAASNYSSGTVSVLLGNGAGGFTAPAGAPPPIGAQSLGMAAGDFNGDAIQDLATVSSSAGTLSVLLGNGAGGFATSTIAGPGAGAGALAMASGDLNGDGRPDLVTANSITNTVSTFLGNGLGGFSPGPAPPGVGSGPFAVAIGDLNSDGADDLVTANFGAASISVLLGNGAGGFTAPPVGPPAVGAGARAVAISDLDGDGDQDIATADYFANRVSVLLGDGTGRFVAPSATPPATGQNPFAIASGDVDGDGDQDLAVANLSGASVSVLAGNGGGAAAGNLLTNPGAEGPGAAGNATATPAFGGWTRTAGTPTFVRYAATGGFPSLLDAARWNGGLGFFTGGVGPLASAEQTVPLAGQTASIDAGAASATLAGLLGGYGTSSDAATLDATYLGGAGQALGSPLSIGPVTPADRRNRTVLLRRSATGPIPAGTRAIRVVMTIIRTGGTYNDGYLDDLSLRVNASPPPVVTATAGPRCAGKRATIVARGRVTRGTRRADVIVGRPGADVIRALGGNDIVCGRGGADLIEGGQGRDRLLGQAGADRLRGGAGRDVLLGGPGRDRLLGGLGIDRLIGGPGADRQAQ